jgi:hypothetical protein
MKCNRCQGLMVQDRFLDIQSTGDHWLFAWRCPICGNVEDAQTRHNRSLHPSLENSPTHGGRKKFPLPIYCESFAFESAFDFIRWPFSRQFSDPVKEKA